MIRRAVWLVCIAAALAVLGCARRENASEAQIGPALIPRTELFADPERTGAQISPRGDRIAYLAPVDGVLNVWVGPTNAFDQAQPVTQDRGRGVRRFVWSGDGTHILYLQDDAGDENWRLYAVDLTTSRSIALTPAQDVRADILSVAPSEPDFVVAAMNDRDPSWRDVYRINIRTGAREIIARNMRGFADFVVDRENVVRLGLLPKADGGMEIWSRDPSDRWRRIVDIPFRDVASSMPIGFESDGRAFLMFDSVDRERAALVRVDAQSGVKTILGESPRADVVDLWVDPRTQTAEAFSAEYLRREWRALNDEAQADLTFLESHLQGDAIVKSRSLDDSRWIVVEQGPTSPGATWLYDRTDPQQRRLTLLFRERPALAARDLQPMIPLEIETRDGVTLVAYLTLPPGADANGDGRPEQPVPLALIVHGGPWMRDSYGFNATHQWLANRGYAVLSVNFRGSTGFGPDFLNAANREWGGLMQDDLYDAVQWAIDENIAQADKVAIYGASYGGYAALAGLAFSPGRFACGVSLSGPSNLQNLLASVPRYWAPYRAELARRIGDPDTPEGRARLRRASPFYTASTIRDPLLIAQGGNDPRAPRADSDGLAQTLATRRRSFAYVVFPDEGHGLARPQNRLAFTAVTEAFLAQCLGGRAEAIGHAFDGSSLMAYAGAQFAPALSSRMRRLPASNAAQRRPANAPEQAAAPSPADIIPPADLPISTARPRARATPEPERSEPAQPRD